MITSIVGGNVVKLFHLAFVRQQHDESVVNYIKRFRDTKTYDLVSRFLRKNLADLVFPGLHSYIKEKLEGHNFASVNQVLGRALAQVNWSRDLSKSKSDRFNIYFLSNDLDALDDGSNDTYATEFTWSSEDKSHTCASLNPIYRNWQDELKYTFDVGKCDKIYDELLRIGKIRLSHAILLIEELEKWAYYKWHSSYPHVTNGCNVFWQ
jgi:hypothetical protein